MVDRVGVVFALSAGSAGYTVRTCTSRVRLLSAVLVRGICGNGIRMECFSLLCRSPQRALVAYRLGFGWAVHMSSHAKECMMTDLSLSLSHTHTSLSHSLSHTFLEATGTLSCPSGVAHSFGRFWALTHKIRCIGGVCTPHSGQESSARRMFCEDSLAEIRSEFLFRLTPGQLSCPRSLRRAYNHK